MRLTTSILNQLSAEHPNLVIKKADDFAWNPDKNSVFFDESHPNSMELLLHELAHGILNHKGYIKDIELLTMEAKAWDQASEIANKFGLTLDNDVVQDHMDTYRDWMHARSTCPKCNANGLQRDSHYECLACRHSWRSNEARICGLKRYSLNTNSPT